MRKFLYWLFCALSGCYHFPDIHYTPKYSIPVHVRGDVSVDQDTVDAWIDTRADEWIAHKSDWGCQDFSDEQLREAVKNRPVIVYSGWFLSQDSSGDVMGQNITDTNFMSGGSQIKVTIDFPAIRQVSVYDPDYCRMPSNDDDNMLFSFGVRQLPHEWTHTARGAWHP